MIIFLPTIVTFLLTWLSCLAGFLAREAMAFTTRRSSGKIDLRYYWSVGKNRWNVAINGAITIVVMWARGEIIGASQSEYIRASWPFIATVGKLLMQAPYITGFGIGLFAAFVVRWAITTVDQRWGRSAKLRKAAEEEQGNEGN